MATSPVSLPALLLALALAVAALATVRTAARARRLEAPIRGLPALAALLGGGAIAVLLMGLVPGTAALAAIVAGFALVSLVAAAGLLRALPAWPTLRAPEALAAAKQQAREEAAQRQQAEDDRSAALAARDRAVRELEQFAYIISHDLQTPLRTISGFSQLLDRRHRDRLDGDALEFLGYIDQGARQMTRQIQDLLTLSRISRSDTAQIERRPLAETLGRAIKACKADIDASGAEIAYGTLPEVEANHALLAQALSQLLDNAIRYARPGQRPKICIDIARDGDAWRLTVADDGIGIPADQLDAIFLVFRQLRPTPTGRSTGIGLAICRKIAEYHGGSIHAQSDGPDRGSALVLRLPVAVPRQRLELSAEWLRGG